MVKNDRITKIKEFIKLATDDNKPLNELKEGYMDEANVCMIIPKKEKLATLLSILKYEDEELKIPKLDESKFNTSKLSVEYLLRLAELLKASGHETVKLSIGNDYPLKAETESFIFILAPRVEND